MPDDTSVDTGESAGSSNDSGESGGASASAGAEATTDWKARAIKAEKDLAKFTGKAGADKAALTDQITALSQRASEAEGKAKKAERQIAEREVLLGIVEEAPSDYRKLFVAAAKGMLSELEDLSNPTEAVKAVLAKLKERAPAASANPMPHVQVGDAGNPGVVMTPGGKRLF